MSAFAELASDVVLDLAPEPAAARRVRRALHEARLPEDLQHTVDLLATELVANALRHAELQDGERILFAARWVGDHVRVEVHDPGNGFDPEQGMRGKGFGLRMVDKLATRWGVERDRGTRVWFEIDRRSRRRFHRD